MNDQSPAFSYQADMGFTRQELLKGLPTAVYPYQLSVRSDLLIEITLGQQCAQLSLQPEKSRKIASITLPVTAIRLDFFGFDETQYQAFMTRFKRYLHRGGG